MSNFPTTLDDDVTLPRVDDNITEIGGEAINALREAVFSIEEEIGIGASGTAGSIADRLGVSLEANGNIKPSAIASMGLVTLPITDTHISAVAAIQESKLALAYSTTTLNSRISQVSSNVTTALNFITNHGFKLEPHLSGSDYNHYMTSIDVIANSANYFKNKSGVFRDNTNLYTLFDDINNDYIAHQVANGQNVTVTAGTQSGGTLPPTNYAHNASGIHLNTSNFSFVPQTAIDLQQFAQFIDNSNIFILGTRIQTLYSTGIPRTARAAALTDAERGQPIVPSTPAYSYLLNGGSTSPVDSIDNGDDVIEFLPDAASIANHSFDAKFNQVKVGDIVTVVYTGFQVNHIVKEKKYTVSGGNKKYLVRIDGRNSADQAVTAYINRPLFNINKYGVLALAQARISGLDTPGLIIGNPRSAEVLGVGFSPDVLDSAHYNLYLAFYPDGNPASQTIPLPAIDVTGNQGKTPGSYTLDFVVKTINDRFRKEGYNNRFMAFSYNGELGIKMTDAINNASFSIIDGIVATNGLYNQSLSATAYPNNVIGVPGFDSSDALGFGPGGAAVSSPSYTNTFPTAEASQTPTKVHAPLTKKNFYVNGVERERFELEPNMSIDGYGDGYWSATIKTKNIIPGTRVEVTYEIPFDLSTSRLAIGKTITVVAGTGGTYVDSGRFYITDVQFDNCGCEDAKTTITVWDAIQSPTGNTPYVSAAVGTPVSIYFSSGSSIVFNDENLSDASPADPFKRHMEVYIDQDGYTFGHERARMNISGTEFDVNSIPLYSSPELVSINIVKVSPKLRGYAFSSVTKINLTITSYDEDAGIFSGYLCKYDGSSTTNQGPTTIGKKGNVVRFYDETYVNYIDLTFDLSNTSAPPNINSTKRIDIQLFPTLSLDDELMLLGTVQLTDNTSNLDYLRDERQFGNVSEKQLSTSALDYIAAPTRLLEENGIVRGFEISSVNADVSTVNATVTVTGGTAIINGKIVQLDTEIVKIQPIVEVIPPSLDVEESVVVNWFLCVNDKGEMELIASTDYDPNGGSASVYNSAGLDHTRLFYGLNTADGSGTYYPIKATYFADLVLNYTNVTPIALISVNISDNEVVSISKSDLRRFVGGGYKGLTQPFTLGSKSSFRSFEALDTWLQQLCNFNSFVNSYNNIGTTVLVKDAVDISGVTFDYQTKIKFVGDGGKFTLDSSTATLTKNVEFENLTIDVPIATGFNLTDSNIAFNKCTINYTYDASLDGSFTSTKLSNPLKACIIASTSSSIPARSGLKFTNSKFVTDQSSRFAFISLLLTDETHSFSDVEISNNKFENTLSSDDKRAVIIMGCTSIATPTTQLGPRLIGCSISKNICDKNQLILISGSVNGSSKVANMPVPVNVTIEQNICGAICYLVRQDRALNIANTTVINDKDNMLIISKNMCRYIYCGTIDGFINVIGSVNRVTDDIITGANIYYSSVIIEKNTCSWIHVGVKNPTSYAFETPMLEISSNKLNAYNSTFLNDYHSVISPNNIGLIVDSVVGT